MEIITMEISEVKLVRPRIFDDSRGFFLETYSQKRYAEMGMPAEFVQDNHSQSSKDVIRGLHYQLSPGQAKLIHVVRGEIFDVAVDIRRGSPTFGKWVGATLSAENKHQLFVPTGFAHGFAVMSDIAEVEYKVDDYYNAEMERGIAWDDPAIGVDWPVESPVLSDRDKGNPSLADAEIDAEYTFNELEP